MKTLTIILIVLVSLALVFSLASFIIIITGNAGNIKINFSHPTATQEPIPTYTQEPFPPQTPNPDIADIVAISYNETYREVIGNNSRIVLTVNATFIRGTDISINYSQFNLNLYVWRISLHEPVGTAYPLNNGTFALGISNKTYIFQLIFEFSSDNSNGMDIVPTQYNLNYNGPASIQWTYY